MTLCLMNAAIYSDRIVSPGGLELQHTDLCGFSGFMPKAIRH
jgi:hypothetical protein